MASSSPRSAFRDGVRAGSPMILVIVPFAVVFGVIATEAGLTAGEAMGFSILVIAGSSQLAAIQMMTENAPFWAIVATALAVNLRMAMYSAALVPHLGGAPLLARMLVAYLNVDQTYALSIARYETGGRLTGPEKLAYFTGTAAPIFPLWYLGTLAGALAGRLIPSELSLEAAVPIAFMAIVALMLRTTAHWVAAITSVVVALSVQGVPYNLGVLIAAGAAMVAGAIVETRSGAA